MATKTILLAVGEPHTLVDITQALGSEWEAISVASEEDALEQLEKRSFGALLVDFNLGSPDASDLLNLAVEKHPQTVRFLLAYEADVALVAAKVQGSPHLLPKPVDPISLKSRIEDGVLDSNPEEDKGKAAEPVTTTAEEATTPSIYADVLKALEAPDATSEQVGEIIGRDAALTSEILSLTHSSYLGLPRDINNPVEAVESLGLETVRAAVMALRFLAEHAKLRPGYLSLDQIWQHSINVGQIARDLILFETKDHSVASRALTAGLLHDLGKVVLAKNFDDLYGRVNSLARKQPVAIWEVEREMFGANHGEIGACLVGMWNMPSDVVDAVALHHEPPVGEHDELTPLAAVHIGNVLERELWLGREDVMVAPVINTTFLNHIGLLQRLPVWRAAFRNRKSVNLDPELEAAQTHQSAPAVLSNGPASRSGNHLRGAATRTRTGTFGGSEIEEDTPARLPYYRRSWVHVGIVGALVLLAVWFRTQPEVDQTKQIYARTPAMPYEFARVSEPAPKETFHTSESVTAPATHGVAVTEEPSVSDEPADASPASEAVSKPVAPPAVPKPAVTSAPSATTSNAPPVVVVPRPDFRLNGIIFTALQPCAIVNGQTVRLGDKVDGATVVDIGPTNVTLQIKGQRKNFALR